MFHNVREFEGHVGMVAEHDRPLIPPGCVVTARIEKGSGDDWKTVGTLTFNSSGSKLSFKLSPDLDQAVRRSNIPAEVWQGTQITSDRLSQEMSLARLVSKLAAQVHDLRDIDHYHDNPIHLPTSGYAVLRVTES